MGTGPKVALAVAAIAVAIVLLVVLRPGDEDDEAELTTPATTVVTTTDRETARPRPRPRPRPRRSLSAEIVVEGGEVSGPERVRLEEGSGSCSSCAPTSSTTCTSTVTTSCRDVGPGQPARFAFRVTDPGRFDVELEDRQQPLTELVVSP